MATKDDQVPLTFDKLRFNNIANPEVRCLLVQGYLRHNKELQYLLENFPRVLTVIISKFLDTTVTIHDFEPVSVIGSGIFGVVRLVKHKYTKKYFALKTVTCNEVKTKDICGARNFMMVNELNKMQQRSKVIDEKSGDMMMKNENMNDKYNGNRFLVSLEYAFCDTRFAHFVMEFCDGCNFLKHLMHCDIMSEVETCFYIIEICLGINAIHNLGFVYRELKPSHVFICKDGHIKLGDFGYTSPKTSFVSDHFWKEFKALNMSDINDYNCGTWASIEDIRALFDKDKVLSNADDIDDNVVVDSNSKEKRNVHVGGDVDEDHADGIGKRRRLYSVVGTADYVAPEVFEGLGYDDRVDWWAVGTVLFECIFGFPPFYSDDPTRTYLNVVNYKTKLRFPSRPVISQQLKNLINGLICNREKRFDFNKIKNHEWFKLMKQEKQEKTTNGNIVYLDFENIHNEIPSFVPKDNISQMFKDRSIYDWEAIEQSKIEKGQLGKTEDIIWSNGSNESRCDNQLSRSKEETLSQSLFASKQFYFDRNLYHTK